MVDASEGVLGIEWIEGPSVRALLGGGDDSDEVGESESEVENADGLLDELSPEDQLREFGLTQCMPAYLVYEIGRAHV